MIPLFLSGPSLRGAGDRPASLDSARRWVVVREDAPSTGPDEADATIVARLRVADERAFRDLWEQYHQGLVRFAHRYVRSHDSAADIVQDVFIALWERHAHIEVRGSLAGYLYGMVRYTAMDFRKHERVMQRHVDVTTAAYASAPVVARNLGLDAVEVETLQQLLRATIATLPPRTREIFLMSREDGLAPGAIASVLGIAPQVVYNQLSRALKALHDAVKRSA